MEIPSIGTSRPVRNGLEQPSPERKNDRLSEFDDSFGSLRFDLPQLLALTIYNGVEVIIT